MTDQSISTNNPIVIAGAGPGGLSLALCLHQRGIPTVVREAVGDLKPLGVGINLLPHSVRVLHDLGLREPLEQLAIQTSELRYVNKFGQHIWSEPRGVAAGYAYPQYSIHRGELQLLLLETVRQRIGPNAVRSGCALESWRDAPDGITVKLRDMAGSVSEIETTGLIAADGIHSVARRRLYPGEGPPRYSGRILWRATTEAEPFLDGRTMIMAGHQHQKFVAYPISRPHAEQGRSLINWIAELDVPDWVPPRQDWNRQVAKKRFRERFASWRFDWLDVPSLIDAAEAVYEYPMVDRDPLPRWTHGRMTLLGDAAHPMYPIGSNGASQAILDAESLANHLAATDNAPAAFQAYDDERRPPTASIVLMNRANGPEQVMQLAEERAPNGFTDIHDVIPQDELEEIAARYKQIAGFSVEQVNRKVTEP
ncbi:MAG TPA: flavin-dependent oxidoreductase [Thermomicrobiales bacterium]|nr:flavin-dependent oxidoreductase [Thermomicrobiales bacterium]